MSKSHLVLLYYYYYPIKDPDAFRNEHHQLCLKLQLKGRIIVSPEGINGTVSGLSKNCQEYMKFLQIYEGFENIAFKVHAAEGHTFEKLHIRCKKEIVNSGLVHIDPNRKTGSKLSPVEFKAMKDQDDVILLDTRSCYEAQIGKFKNAVTLDIQHFREFPKVIKELAPYKQKKIITYCTGGVRCEKASAFLLENGFEKVYQLDGGIIRYAKEEGGEDFEGVCYVFDNRVTVEVNKVNPSVISKCHICYCDCQRMVNCANPECNTHIPICPNCYETLKGACSLKCKEAEGKRPYTSSGYYPKKSNGYNPYKCSQR